MGANKVPLRESRVKRGRGKKFLVNTFQTAYARGDFEGIGIDLLDSDLETSTADLAAGGSAAGFITSTVLEGEEACVRGVTGI